MKKVFTKIYQVIAVIIFISGTALTVKAQGIRNSIATGVWASAVARDGSGSIYVIENPGFGTSAEVLKYTGGKGAPTTIFTADLDDNGGVLNDYAFGLAVTNNGDVYVSSAPDNAHDDGKIIRLICNSANGTYTPATFLTGSDFVNSFTSLAVDANDNLFVIQTDFRDPDSNPLEVAEYAASGGVPQATSFTILYNFSIVTNDNYTTPVGLSVDASGNVYVAEPFNMNVPGADGGQVIKLTKSTGYSASQFTSGKYTSTLGSDPLGNIYATTSTYTSNGTYIPFSLVEYAGGSASSPVTLYTGLGGGNADFFPFGIAALSPSDIFVADGFETLDATPQHNPIKGNLAEIIGAPATQASNVSFSNITKTTASINWTNGSGASRAVFIAASTSGDISVTNGTLYTANTAFGSGTAAGDGWYCIYNGSGSTNSVDINNLSASTGYEVMAIEYNGSTGLQNYLTTTAINNPNTFTTSDSTPPTVSAITATGASTTNATSVGYTVTFSKAVTGVDDTDFTATTTGVTTTGITVTPVSNSVYTVTINGVSGDGTLRLDLNSSDTGIADLVDNAISGGFTSGDTYTIDQTAPTLSAITATSASTTNATSVGYTVTFSEAVTGVTSSAFTATTSGISTRGISVTPVSSTVYTVTVDGISGTGTLRLDLNGSGAGITDAADNAISGGFTGGDTYTIDQTAPSVSAIIATTPTNATPTNATSVSYTVTFSEAVTGVTSSAFTPTTSGVITTGVTVTPVSSSVYTITVNGAGGNGTLRLDLNNSGTGITDFADNPISGGFTGGDTYTLDQTPPTAAISAPSADSIGNAGSGSVTYTVTYADANFSTSTLSTSDITLNTTGTASGTVEVSNSGMISTVTISGITGSGTLGISIGAGTALDLAGNLAPASGPSSTFTVIFYDATLSNLAISSGTLDPSFASGVTSYTASVATVKKKHTVFTMGDSITSNNEYQITLDSLLNGVFTFVNFGVSGNKTFNMLNRFSGVTDASPDYVIILGGVNDIGSGYTAAQIENNLQAMYTSAHNAGSKVIALTITPFKGTEYWTPALQTVQNAVNLWMDTAKNVDYVIDTYTSLVDPSNPQQLLPAYDSGDHIHPSKAGQDEIAAVIHSGAVFTPSSKIDQSNADTLINVTPVTTDPNATVTVNGIAVTSGSASAGIPLNVGLNTINTVVTAQDGITAKTYALMVMRDIPIAPALSSLNTNSVSLSPAFSPEITKYTASVTNAITSLTIMPIANDTLTITVNDVAVASGSASAAIPLNLGANTISIVVTAPDGTTQTYTITVTQASNNAQLASLMLNPHSALTLTSGSGFEDFTASVSNATASVTVTPVAQDASATITVNGTPVTSGMASGSISLAIGANTISTIVTAQDGITTGTYTITVIRAPSGNALLSIIKLTPASTLTNTGTVGSTTTYATSVSNATTSVTVTATTQDPAATVTVNGTAVTSGAASAPIALPGVQTVITTVVTAQDGTTTRTYSITVTRIPSSNAALSIIKLTPASTVTNTGTVGSTTTYATSVSNATTSVTVAATTQDPAATVTVNGTAVTSGAASAPIALPGVQTVITTVVTAQDGTTTRTYSITVTRIPSSNAALSIIKLTPASTLTNTGTVGSTTTYTTSVSNATASVTVTPTAQDINATIKVNGTTDPSGTASGSIALAEGTTTIINTMVTSQDGTTTKTYSVIVTRAPSNNASLSVIKLTPASALTNTGTVGTTTTYTTSVSNATASVTVTPTAQDANATIKVNGVVVASGTASGSIALAEGATMTINTIVTAQDGTTTHTYSIAVTRAPSNNALLSVIKLTPASALTNTGTAGITTTYTTTVTNATASVTVTPTAQDANATIKVNGVGVASGTASGSIALAEGATMTINTIVTAQDGTTTHTYSIAVTRAPSSNASLSVIKLTPASALTNTGTIGTTTSYTTSVSNATASVTVTPTAQDANATIKVKGTAMASGTASGSIALAVGNNTITTVVTAQDGTTIHTYSITITRAAGPLMSLYQPVQPEVSVIKPTDNVTIENDRVMVHQGVSPNGDGLNDYLHIDCLAAYPDNKVTIIDRSGAVIFEARGYNNITNVFDGHTGISGKLLQPGTYFYSLEYNVNGQNRHKTGFILLKY